MSEELNRIIDKDPDQKEFHQAVREVIDTVQPLLDRHPEYRQDRILERIAEPERTIIFRVPWIDDAGRI